MTERLATALEEAASGDVDAFMAFFDATSNRVYALELMRASASGERGTYARQLAEEATYTRYLTAWRFAACWRDQPLSPLAWLLSIPLLEPTDPVMTLPQRGLACA